MFSILKHPLPNRTTRFPRVPCSKTLTALKEVAPRLFTKQGIDGNNKNSTHCARRHHLLRGFFFFCAITCSIKSRKNLSGIKTTIGIQRMRDASTIPKRPVFVMWASSEDYYDTLPSLIALIFVVNLRTNTPRVWRRVSGFPKKHYTDSSPEQAVAVEGNRGKKNWKNLWNVVSARLKFMMRHDFSWH